MAPPPPLTANGSQSPLERALALLQAGQPQAAATCLQEARRLYPEDPKILYQLGNSLRLCGAITQASEALEAAIAADPGFADAWFSLAFLHIQQGERARAASTLMGLYRHHPDDAELLQKVAGLLAGIDRNDLAADLYERALHILPRNADAHLQLGIQYQKLGRYEDAATSFRRTIDLNPRLGSAYMLLANNTRLKSGDTAIDRLLAVALQQPGLSPEDEACIHFAFGKIFDDRAQYDTAFHHYRRANELRRPQPPFDRGAWRQMVERIKRVFLNLELPRPTRPATGPRPGFVVGMLRSGTTLTERLLSSLPAVSSLGETELLDTFVQRLAEVKAESYPECVLQLDGNDIAAMTADYRRLISADAGSAAIVLDKNPLNFMHIGMIALLFPDAHIIHCRRHPLDTCLSVYFQNFAHARNNYAYDLEDIAAFYNGYSELMTFWEGLLPGRMITLGYEALITDPESVTRALYAEMNLDWAPEAIHPQSNPGTIATASLWQARQPIYSHSAGRWQNYAKHLDGLRASIEKITAFAPEHSATDTNL